MSGRIRLDHFYGVGSVTPCGQAYGQPCGNMERVTHYDLAVIGTGSGNSIVDERFADWRVAILEENHFGGTCLNVGCIPTKMLVYPADLARSAMHGPALGVETAFNRARWPEIRDRVFGRIDPIAGGGKTYRESLPNVDVYDGHASFADDHTLATGTGEQITADQIVIAVGTRVDVAQIPGLDEVTVHTSDTVMRLDELPARMTIIGGGYVAAEFAHIFSALGTEVTQVNRGKLLLRDHDEEISERFTQLAARQWDLRTSTLPTRVSRSGEAIEVSLSDGSVLETDVLLMATGRVSNADRLGLEHTSIELDEETLIRVDEQQRTTAKGIWALGDVTGAHQLKHVANHEARTVQHNLLHPEDLVASDHRFVPSAVFTSPQIASVGLTAQQARDEGVGHLTAVERYGDVAYGWAMEDDDHFVKLLSDPSGLKLLGAHVIGPQASLLLQPLVQAMSTGQTIPEIARGQYWIHPSLAEVVENALLKFGVE